MRPDVNLTTTRFGDYALSLVETEAGIARVEDHLIHGTQIQRNDASPFFNRRGDWPVVREAFEAGRIDEIKAYARKGSPRWRQEDLGDATPARTSPATA